MASRSSTSKATSLTASPCFIKCSPISVKYKHTNSDTKCQHNDTSKLISYQVNYAQPILRLSKIWEKWVVSQKKKKKKKLYTESILILLGGNVVWCLLVSLTITCLPDFWLKGFVCYLFKNESISLQRAKLGVGLQNRTPTRSGVRSWYEMSLREKRVEKYELICISHLSMFRTTKQH
jgi:hypothetical protein